VETLEAILSVQEETVEAQSSRLEASLAASRQQTRDIQAQRLQFETITATSPIGIFQTDRDGRCLYTNSAWQNITGRSLAECLGDGWHQAIAEEDRAQMIRQWEETIREGGVCDLEFRMQRPDGTTRWVHNRTHPLRNDRGETIGHVGTTEDITEQKRVAAALRESEARLREAQTMAHLGNWELDLVKNRLLWSDEIFRIFEINQAQFSASYEAFLNAVHPDDRALVNDTYTQSVQNRTPYEIVHRLQMPDGRIKYVQERGETYYDGEGRPQRSVGTVQDITERRESQLQLQRSQALLNSVFDHLPNMVFVKDARTLRFVEFNKAGERLTGFSREELLGKSDYDFFPREEADFFTGKDRAVLAKASMLDIPEEEIQTKHRGIRFLQTKKVPIYDARGIPQYLLGISEDITERKQAETALIASEERLRLTLEVSTDGVWDWDLSTLQAYYSPRWIRLLGLEDQELSLNNVNDWKARIHPDDRPEVEQALSAHLAGHSASFTAEHRVRHRSGAWKWFAIRGQVTHRDHQGHPRRMMGVLNDITDRKHTETALAQSTSLQQAILIHAGHAIIATDSGGIITVFNPAAERLLGYQAEEMIGTLNPAVFHDSGEVVTRAAQFGAELGITLQPGFDVFVEKARRNLPNQHEWTYVRKDGQRLTVLLSVTALRDHAGTITGYLGLALDLTDRKKSEASRFRLQKAVNHAQDGMALLDDTGQYVYMNPAYAAIYGYSIDELLGRSWKDLYHPEWAAMIEQLYLPTLHADGQWQGEVVGKKKSGDAFHVDLSLTLLEEPGTQGHSILCTCRDISNRKKLEHDLITAKEAAEAGIRAKCEFLANMSHEIRTPMNGVIGMTGLLLDTALSPEQREYAETLRASGESLLTLINDILDFSKIEAGKLDLELIPFDLRHTLDQVLEVQGLFAQQKGLELVGLVNADVPLSVVGDPGRIKQIITNLTSNAIKFTDHGEVSIVVSRLARTEHDITLRIDVTDTGIGIDSDAQARLFQSFSQADSSTTRKFGGTGLGLAICKQLVELMHGTIHVESSPGHGSRFWFNLRLGQADAVSPHAVAATDLHGKRICIVDDTELNRRALTQHATRWGMDTCLADCADSALTLLRDEQQAGRRIDVAVLDMQMPDMTGLALARQMKADPSLKDIPLILLTSIGRRGEGKSAHEAGIAAYLTKPVRNRQLADCIRLVLARPQESREPAALITRHTLLETAAQTRGHLLVVDDNPVNQKVAVKMLEKLGHRVDVAGNGKEALQALAQHPYHLVFMDCQMPEMDGFEATRKIRAHEQPGRQLPVIAMTANAMEGDRERCLESGMDDFVSKPVKSQDLQRVLTQWLNLSDNRAAA